MYFQLAWRNIWRNKRRTAIILTAVVIGVWSMILLGSLMRGMAVGMIKNGISTLTGHIQIHRKGYRADPAIENSIPDPRAVTAAKDLVFSVANRPLDTSLIQDTAERITRVRASEEGREGVSAFLEKRAPGWVADKR